MSNTSLKSVVRWAAAGLATFLTGCGGGFFIDTPGSTSTTSSTSDYVFVANQTTSTLSAYSVGTGGLALVSGSPYSLLTGLAPASVAVSRANTYVYVGGRTEIVGYSIGTGGVLTSVAAATIVAQNSNFVSLDTSPDGKWLLALDSLNQTVSVYQITAATGALALASSVNYTTYGSVTPVARSIRIAANGTYVIACLNSGGDVTFTFNTGNGALTQTNQYPVPAGFVGDNDVTIDSSSGYAYFARANATSGASVIASYSIGTNATLTSIGSIASGDAPYSVRLDANGTYLYAANRTSNNISGYTASGGVMKALTGSPYASGTGPTALAEDNGKSYLIAASQGGSSDISVYKFDAITVGQLDAVQVLVSGNDPAGSAAIATTH